MAGNIFGKIFQLTTFGESHGPAIGGVIDGCPAGISLDFDAIQNDLIRRKPGQSAIVTQRKEADEVEFYSGVFEGKTTGTPIGFVIHNTNQKSKDYSHIKDSYRPSHADYVYDQKYGIRDYRGGGRSSARETASRVVAGAIAKQFLSPIKITAYVSKVGSLGLEKPYSDLHFDEIEKNPVRCPDAEMAQKMENYIKEVRKAGDTVGGIVSAVIQNVPVGLGEPAFDKLHALLGHAMLSINASSLTIHMCAVIKILHATTTLFIITRISFSESFPGGASALPNNVLCISTTYSHLRVNTSLRCFFRPAPLRAASSRANLLNKYFQHIAFVTATSNFCFYRCTSPTTACT